MVKRLAQATLADLPPHVRRPRYDRTALAIGMAHLGVGAFHRCHQAEYTDDMIEAAFGPWGVIGINVRPPDIQPALGPQDGLYVRGLTADGTEPSYRAIGCIRGVIDATGDPGPALAVLADGQVVVTTLTITEKGYCHVPATGALDETHADILHDLAHPETPRSVPGLLVEALKRRGASGAAMPMTIVSCDNIPANGAILERAVRTVAEQRSPALARWIGDNVAFPSTMVDRIVPAVTESDRARTAEAIAMEDQASVTGEPFRQWVIENRFAGRRPPWDLAGAEFVDDVASHELIKMRVLNGAQSAFCTLGAILGLTFTHEDARHPVLSRVVERMLTEETASTLPYVQGMASGAYIQLSLSRLRNTAIRHTNHQIATDGSQKVVQRLLNPMRERIRQGRAFDLLACGVAGFIVYLARASNALGAAWTPSDPFADVVRQIADETGPAPDDLVRRILSLSAIFGTDIAANPAAVSTLTRHVAGLLSGNPLQYLSLL